MSTFTYKYFTPQQIEHCLTSNEIDAAYHNLFKDRLENYLMEVELEGDDSCSKDEWAISSLEYVLGYVKTYDKQLKAGHGVRWAACYAHEAWLEGEDRAFSDTWDTIQKENQQLAMEELNIYCNSLSADKIYKERFIEAITEDLHYYKKAHEVAATWSSTFYRLINSGKSEFYAKLYLETSELYSLVYTEKYVDTYQSELDKGRSDAFASTKAAYAAELYDDHLLYSSKLDDYKKDEIEDIIKGYMDGWEYARDHNLKCEFIDFYQDTYLERGRKSELYQLRGDEQREKILEIAIQRYSNAIIKPPDRMKPLS